MNTIRNEITYGGYFAALCSPAFVLFTASLMNIKVDLPILVISYILPLIVYSYDYYKDIDKDIQENSKRASFLKKKAKKYPYVLSFYIILLISLLIMFFNFNLIIFIILLITIGILYNIAFKDLTKKIPLFKNIYTALTWALGGTFFPILYYSLDINLSFIIMFFLIFLRVMINVIFFDLKDIDNDTASRIKTLPVILGKKSTIKILNSMNIISFIPLILGIYFNIISFCAISLLILCIYGYFYINKATSASSNELESAAHTLADFEFIIWPLILIIAKIIV
ncbi:MAG: UbiA family prenyltransferase [Methanobacterium sp.]|nr:UbiA family prenyltransferase [Methanobacterium sp.]